MDDVRCGEVAVCPSHGQDQRAGCFGSAALNFFPTSACHPTLFLYGPRNLSARTNSSIFAITSSRDQRRSVMSVASLRHAQVVRKCHWRVCLARAHTFFEVIGRNPRHPHRLRRRINRAHRRQRNQKQPLPLRRPTIMPHAVKRDRGKFGFIV